MKNITTHTLWGLTLLLLISCNNEELLQEYEESAPIHFTYQNIDILTKSTTKSNNKLTENTQVSLFSIQHSENSIVDHWEPTLFNNTMGITNISGDILYNNTYYFPIDKQLDFFAIHPFISTTNTGSDYDGTQLTNIILKENVNEQYDLMYASLLNQSKNHPY